MWRVAIAVGVLAVAVAGCGRRASPDGNGSRAADDAHARAAFDRYRQPDRLVAALGLRRGDAVADVGAGTGYLTHRLAAAVGPGGRVVATDVDGALLAQIGAAQAGEAPIATRVVAADDPGLEPGAYDRVLVCEVDHLLADRAAWLTRAARALKPGGRLAVCNRRLYRAPLVEAATRAGLTVAAESQALPAHFLVLLEVPR